jgi:hypothetical protein
VKSWRDLGLDKSLPDYLKKEFDGGLSDVITYEEWLREQPESFQKSFLGEARYKLWSAGRIRLSQMVKKDGKLLSEEQLLRSYGR